MFSSRNVDIKKPIQRSVHCRYSRMHVITFLLRNSLKIKFLSIGENFQLVWTPWQCYLFSNDEREVLEPNRVRCLYTVIYSFSFCIPCVRLVLSHFGMYLLTMYIQKPRTVINEKPKTVKSYYQCVHGITLQ